MSGKRIDVPFDKVPTGCGRNLRHYGEPAWWWVNGTIEMCDSEITYGTDICGKQHTDRGIYILFCEECAKLNGWEW